MATLRFSKWAAAAGSILLGLPYLLRTFGPTEAEVQRWGLVSLVVGVALVIWAVVMDDDWNPLARWVWGVAGVLLTPLHILPAVLWVLFHGGGISDGTPSSPFVAHWLFALPHLLMVGLGVWLVMGSLFPRAALTEGRKSS